MQRCWWGSGQHPEAQGMVSEGIATVCWKKVKKYSTPCLRHESKESEWNSAKGHRCAIHTNHASVPCTIFAWQKGRGRHHRRHQVHLTVVAKGVQCLCWLATCSSARNDSVEPCPKAHISGSRWHIGILFVQEVWKRSFIWAKPHDQVMFTFCSKPCEKARPNMRKERQARQDANEMNCSNCPFQMLFDPFAVSQNRLAALCWHGRVFLLAPVEEVVTGTGIWEASNPCCFDFFLEIFMQLKWKLW